MDIDLLKSVLKYNKDSGVFTWVKTGINAGYNDRYQKIGFNGKNYSAHRLAWFYETGVWPAGQVDHVNQNKLDNRFSNLRLATASDNRCNVGLKSNNKSGVKGVSWERGCNKWRAQICLNRQMKYLGLFLSIEEAKKAYADAAVSLHGEFASY